MAEGHYIEWKAKDNVIRSRRMGHPPPRPRNQTRHIIEGQQQHQFSSLSAAVMITTVYAVSVDCQRRDFSSLFVRFLLIPGWSSGGVHGVREDCWLVRTETSHSFRWSSDSCFPCFRLITPNGMKASEETTEEQSRQVHFSFPQWFLRLIAFRVAFV